MREDEEEEKDEMEEERKEEKKENNERQRDGKRKQKKIRKEKQSQREVSVKCYKKKYSNIGIFAENAKNGRKGQYYLLCSETRADKIIIALMPV